MDIVVATPHPATPGYRQKMSTKLAGGVAALSCKWRGEGENDKSL